MSEPKPGIDAAGGTPAGTPSFEPSPDRRPGSGDIPSWSNLPATPERWFDPALTPPEPVVPAPPPYPAYNQPAAPYGQPGPAYAPSIPPYGSPSQPYAPSFPAYGEPVDPAVNQQRPDRSGGSRGGRLFGLLLAVSLIGAVIGGGGTYVALNSSGAFQTKAVVQTTVTDANVKVESEDSAVISAVQKVGPAVVTIIANTATGQAVGSGIIYDAGGWIVTNRHVVAGATDLQVKLRSGATYTGTLYGTDTLTDLAIIKISGATGLTVAPIGTSSTLQVGEMAIAIGSPLGLDYPNSVTSGIVSALGRDVTVANDTGNGTTALHGMIQTDAAINPGNSGGPLLNASGQVIGIDTALEASAQGIGFAIPIDIAKPIMQQALAGQKLSRPYIGVSYLALDPGLASQNKLAINYGAWVHAEDANGNPVNPISAGSPAQKAGLQDGDIITKLEGQSIDATHRLEDLLVQYAPGHTISLEVYRGGKYITIQLTLGTRPTPAS